MKNGMNKNILFTFRKYIFGLLFLLTSVAITIAFVNRFRLLGQYVKARLRYQGGKAILLELLDASNQVRQARLNQLEISFDYQLARIELDQLLAIEDSDVNDASLIQR